MKLKDALGNRAEAVPLASEGQFDRTATGGPGARPARRFLIVNADDFGRTHGVNEGVMQAHREGVVTSASLMVRWPASDEAAAYALESGDLGLGLHLDLGEWVHTDHGWDPVYQVVSTDDAEAVERELANQLGRFHKLMGRSATHIDSHQHVHRSEPVRSVVADFARRLSIPVRELSDGIAHCGAFYGQSGEGSPHPEGITIGSFIGLLDSLQPGVTELSCHPGMDDDAASIYSSERAIELSVLCAPAVRRAIDQRGVELVSYGAVRHAGDGRFEIGDLPTDGLGPTAPTAMGALGGVAGTQGPRDDSAETWEPSFTWNFP